MSLELKCSQLFEFKPSALETFDLNREGIYAKQLVIEQTFSLVMRIQVTRRTPKEMVHSFNK